MPVTSQMAEKQRKATKVAAARAHDKYAPTPAFLERIERRRREDEAFARLMGEPVRYR